MLKIKRLLPHIVAIIVFVALGYLYFYPQLSGFNVKQSDFTTYVGMSKEVKDTWDKYDEDPLWTNSMFSGMPAYQITVKMNSNWIKQAEAYIIKALKYPAALVIIAMISFYILLLCFKVDPWLGIIGSVAYGFAAINILYIGGGHITKVHAIALMPLVIGGVIFAFRREMILGGILTALFLCLQVSANHLQETYYLIFLIFAIVVVELYRHFIEKKLVQFAKVCGVLIIAALLGVAPAFFHLKATADYGKLTMRGASDLTITAGDDASNNTSGLDKDYIKQYSMSKGEVWSLVVPNVKGVSGIIATEHAELVEESNSRFKNELSYGSSYWGEQLASGGTFYLGITIFLLFVLGMVMLKDPLKWGLLAIVVMSAFLSMKNSAFLDFFIDHVPLFNKFRDTKMILVLVQASLPLLGMLFLYKLYKEQLPVKKILIVIGAVFVFFLAFYATPTTFFDFINENNDLRHHQQISGMFQQQGVPMANFNDYRNDLEDIRIEIFREDVGRSLLFILMLGTVLVLATLKQFQKRKALLFIVVGILVVADIWTIDKRYLNNEKEKSKYVRWHKDYDRRNPYDATPVDNEIYRREEAYSSQLLVQSENKRKSLDVVVEEAIQKERKDWEKGANIKKEESKIRFRELGFATNYRVFELSDPFNSSRASYFHKSIGGYHGAKLKRYQEMISFHISKEFSAIKGLYSQKVKLAENAPEMSYYDLIGAINYFNGEIAKGGENAAEMKAYLNQYSGMLNNFRYRENMMLDIFLKDQVVLNMLNTKYIIEPSNGILIENQYALGSAWFVKDFKLVENANQEMLALFDPDNLDYTDGQKLDVYRKDRKFRPDSLAIINAKFSDLLNGFKTNFDPSASIVLESYKPNQLVYKTNATADQLAVFSEVYYQPGWNAYIDGNLADHFQVNYILRGMIVPAGSHTIEYKFEPAGYYFGQKVSVAGSALLFLLLIGGVFYNIRKKKSVTKEN